MDVYMDEKWKQSSKDGRSASCSAAGRRMAALATAAATSGGSAEGGVGGPAFLKASASTREGRRPRTTPRSFSSRCANFVKEQRARFYIMRRCVTMLICWRDYP